MPDLYVCPFCSGSKTTPFVRAGSSQNCTECNSQGMIKGAAVRRMGLESFVNGYVNTNTTQAYKTIKLKLTLVSNENVYVELTREGALELIERIKEQLK